MLRFSYRSVVGMGSSLQDLADALMIIFKTNSSVDFVDQFPVVAVTGSTNAPSRVSSCG